MAISQNGWVVRENSSGLADFPWVTGRVLPGDVFTILNYVAKEFNSRVEPIRKDHSWGWAYRAVRGASVFSNHASGTAVDFNAPSHPLGRSGTFSPAQIRTIHDILRPLDGVVRWGGDYSGRKDEMHFEINRPAQHVAAIAALIRNAPLAPGGGGGTSTPSKPTLTPKPEPDFLEELMSATPIRFFKWSDHIFEADLLSGTYWRIDSMQTLRDRRSVLDGADIPWQNHPGGSGDVPGAVVNGSAFGKQVGS